MSMEVKNYSVNSVPNSDFQRKPLFSFGLKLQPQLNQDKFEKNISAKSIQPKTVSFGTWHTNWAKKTISRFDFKSICPYERLAYLDKFNILPKVNEDFVLELDEYTDILIKALQKKAKGKSFQFVSIGQSPATIAEVLDAKGIDARLCPISKMQKLTDSQIADFRKGGKQEPYFEYLKNNFNLDFDRMLENPGKEFFFVDYTASGESLKNFERILKQRGIAGNNIHFISLNSLTPKENNDFIANFIDRYIQKHELKHNYSPIFTLEAKDAYKIADVAKNTPINENYRNLKLYFLNEYVKDTNYNPKYIFDHNIYTQHVNS